MIERSYVTISMSREDTFELLENIEASPPDLPMLDFMSSQIYRAMSEQDRLDYMVWRGRREGLKKSA